MQLLLAAGALTLVGVAPAEAGPGGYRGGGHAHGHAHAFRRPHFVSRVVIAAPFFYAVPRVVYPAPAYYTTPAPRVYIEQPQPQVLSAPQAWWYYCAEYRAYYPHVQSCPGAWVKVPPTPPPG